MNLIAAADRRWGIGKDGDLLFHLGRDMKYFRKMTRGHVIVMGRKTLDSFPGGKPLPDRTNIVLTRDQSYDGKGALVVHSHEGLFEELKKRKKEEIWVVGGGSLYRSLLPWCRYAHITEVDRVCDADTFMPDLGREPGWLLREKGEDQEEKGYTFRFMVYENTLAKNLEEA